LTHSEVALMCALMLRGAQTTGELRGSASRLYGFTGIEEVEQILNDLILRDEPLIARLPRQPGQKEVRFAHLLSGEIEVEPFVEPERITLPRRSSGEQIEKLEQRVDQLTAEVEALRQQFEEFRKQFD
jgi:uncharacterized protein